MGARPSKVPEVIPGTATQSDPDPRSPTPEITRTPLQNKGDNKHNITKNVDLRKTFESGDGEPKLIHNNPILSAVIKNHLQTYDPRSPTQDFERTPIVITQTNDKIEETNCNEKYDDIHNDSVANRDYDPIVPKNLCNGFFDMTLDDTIQETEPQGSSTILKDTSEATSQEKGGYLETNFDYNDDDKEYEDSQEDVLDNNELSDKLLSILNDNEYKKLIKAQLAHYGEIENDPRSPSLGIERTPIVLNNNLSESTESNENIEEMSDDKLIKVLQNTNEILRQTVQKPLNTRDGLLIYEDETAKVPDSPRIPIANGSGCRTPLSCMKNKSDGSHIRSKSVNTLVTDSKGSNSSKIPRRVSHIPRLKSLSKTLNNSNNTSLKTSPTNGNTGGDYENTPPQSHRDHWDMNTSIVL